MTRSLPTLVTLALFALPTLAHAAIDVQFSPGVTAASGAQAAQLEEEVEAATNAVIKRIAEDREPSAERDAARRLHKVNQVLRILCREEAENDPTLADLFKQSEPGEQGAGGAATRGAFDQAGNPREGGVIIMVIECAPLHVHGWYGGFGLTNDDSMIRILGHELLHASGRAFRHGDEIVEDDELYDPWADRFRSTYDSMLERVQRELRKKARKKKRAQKDGGADAPKNKQAALRSETRVPPECPPESE